MNEEEFDALRPFRPFGVQDAMRAEAKLAVVQRSASPYGVRHPTTCIVNCSAHILKYLLALIWPTSGSCKRAFEPLRRVSATQTEVGPRVGGDPGPLFAHHCCWNSALHGIGSPLRNSPTCDWVFGEPL